MRLLSCLTVVATFVSTTVEASQALCILQPAQNKQYTYIEREGKLHIVMTVIVIHKDQTRTTTKVDKKVPFSLEGIVSMEDYAMKVAQAVYQEMEAVKQQECDKKECNN